MNFITRTETKYLVHTEVFGAVCLELLPYLEKDRYFFYRVHNIYFDNDNDLVITRSLERPQYKEKLRVRMYEHEGNHFQDACIELKKKHQGVVYKRRRKLSLDEARQVLDSGAESIDNRCQILNEILYFAKKTECYPKIYLGYDRYSYFAKGNPDLRLTFDTNIVSRRENLAFVSSASDSEPLLKDFFIMEIKISSSYPLWLTKILNKYKIYPTSFSKYGKMFVKENEKQNENQKLKESA